MKSIAFDLGGTNIKAGLLENGKILEWVGISISPDTDFSEHMKKVTSQINTIIDWLGQGTHEISGIGLAMPGIIDIHQHKVISINKKHEGAVHFNFNEWMSENWSLPLIMDNDARAALVGEWQYGSGKGYNHIVMITLGTGVGGAAMMDGQLIYGKHYQAGCLGGHFTINFHGKECTCGNIGCVESEASSGALGDLVRQHQLFSEKYKEGEQLPDFKRLFELYENKDPLAEDVINHCLNAWSAGIISLIHSYDPEIVIVFIGVIPYSSVGCKGEDILVGYIDRDRVRIIIVCFPYCRVASVKQHQNCSRQEKQIFFSSIHDTLLFH